MRRYHFPGWLHQKKLHWICWNFSLLNFDWIDICWSFQFYFFVHFVLEWCCRSSQFRTRCNEIPISIALVIYTRCVLSYHNLNSPSSTQRYSQLSMSKRTGMLTVRIRPGYTNIRSGMLWYSWYCPLYGLWGLAFTVSLSWWKSGGRGGVELAC